MRLSILGRLEVYRADGTAVPVNGQRVRALLVALAGEPGRVIGTERLIDTLWGSAAPANATNALQALVYRLRGALGRDAIGADPTGYRLVVEPDAVDAARFTRLVDEARTAAPPVARVLLKDALALWRGPALADLDDPAGVARLEESRLAAVEDYAAACLTDWDPAEALALTAREIDTNPTRERLQALHIGALHALGRPADALRHFDRVRRTLADELGVDPSAELAALHLELLRGGPERRSNLPAQLTSFVGRDADVSAVTGLLAAHRLVTLTGPGGAGKTRLAIETAARGAQPDVWLVELAPVGDPGEIAGAVLAVLGVRDRMLTSSPTMEPADPTQRLVRALADRRLVLVLDNCEHLIAAAAGLVAAVLAGAPEVRVLATSREPLGVPGETLYPVPPLQLPGQRDAPHDARQTAAVRLFTDRAGAVAPGFRLPDEDVPVVAQICRRLDGIPLAIELAAARLRLLGPGQIADRIDDRFRLLTAGPRTVLPRHQTLRAVVDWSWDLLDEPERALAARLSVFAGGATLESIEAVGGLGSLDPIAALVDKSLVEVAGGRYRMLETIRAYAAQRLAERGEVDAVRRVHAAHFLALAREAEPRLRTAAQAEWAGRLRAEHDNLAAALRWLIDSRDVTGALRLCAALCGYWLPFGFRSEGMSWARQVVALVPDGPPEGLRREYTLCWLNARLGDLGEPGPGPDTLACFAAEAIPRLDEAAAEGPLHPLLRVVRCVAAMMAGRPREAFTLLAACLRDEDPWLRCATTLMRGMLRFGTGRAGPATADLERAAAGFRELGDRSGLGQALLMLAEMANRSGDSARALALIEEASAQLSPSPNNGGEDVYLMYARLAGARANSGDLEGARSELARARAALPAGAAMSAESHLLMVEADLARRSGDPAAAMAVYESLRAAPAEVGRQQLAMVTCLQARLIAEGGDRERAVDLLREALATLAEIPDLGILLQIIGGFASIEEDPERLATLAGATRTLTSSWLPDVPSAEVAAVLDRARTSLGEARYEAAYAAGRAMDRVALTAYLG
ncbi:BTAD domain-containing putative transcriptional regulator [Rugosimonospora acidiphila]|uniref:BTAD domain-containing putative transcriptional regulator n=1 Tax=Rugosimonospora acidiphila TaxID=556531 RepID=A0ABP9SGE9_9ACTN